MVWRYESRDERDDRAAQERVEAQAAERDEAAEDDE